MHAVLLNVFQQAIICGAVASWPGVCALITQHAGNEIKKTKALDINAFKVFRRVVATAQDKERSGAVKAAHSRAGPLQMALSHSSAVMHACI